ncbi:hypothetical protein [Spirosoma sp.]|uniref:hypothetical protein n=1 Tax=Spirosoma sp. TaxID=1899569 RepID=UPI003B3BDF99
MGTQRLKQVSESYELTPDRILVNWTFSIASLHQHYTTLSNYVKKANEQKRLSTDSRLRNSCIEEIAGLLATMEEELSKFLCDIDQANPPDYQTLLFHTERINRLNQMALTYRALVAE